jgi:hypothetical protein
MSRDADHGLERLAITKLLVRPVDNTYDKTQKWNYTIEKMDGLNTDHYWYSGGYGRW